jgi:hypothetical protein
MGIILDKRSAQNRKGKAISHQRRPHNRGTCVVENSTQVVRRIEMAGLTALQSAALMMLLPRMATINCTTAMFAFKKVYDVLIDWHEFAAELDQLATKGLLLRAGTDKAGRALYRLGDEK